VAALLNESQNESWETPRTADPEDEELPTREAEAAGHEALWDLWDWRWLLAQFAVMDRLPGERAGEQPQERAKQSDDDRAAETIEAGGMVAIAYASTVNQPAGTERASAAADGSAIVPAKLIRTDGGGARYQAFELAVPAAASSSHDANFAEDDRRETRQDREQPVAEGTRA
jgi:hypothetical protein